MAADEIDITFDLEKMIKELQQSIREAKGVEDGWTMVVEVQSKRCRQCGPRYGAELKLDESSCWRCGRTGLETV